MKAYLLIAGVHMYL